MSERITVDLAGDIYALNRLMSDERVVRVHLDGTASHPKNVNAPKVNCGTDDDGQILDVHDKAMVEDLERQGWSVMTGWTGQYSYNGPIMHRSEFVGGHLALEILETADMDTPVDYVALAVDVDSEVCPNESPTCVLSDPCVICHDGTGAQRERENAGWLIAYRPAPADGVMPTVFRLDLTGANGTPFRFVYDLSEPVTLRYFDRRYPVAKNDPSYAVNHFTEDGQQCGPVLSLDHINWQSPLGFWGWHSVDAWDVDRATLVVVNDWIELIKERQS